MSLSESMAADMDTAFTPINPEIRDAQQMLVQTGAKETVLDSSDPDSTYERQRQLWGDLIASWQLDRAPVALR